MTHVETSQADGVARQRERGVMRDGRRGSHRVGLAATVRTPAQPLAPLGALVLVTTGILLLAAESSLYPLSHTGQLGSLRAVGAGVVLTLGGLRVLLGAPGRHVATVCLCLVASLGLCAGALLLAHQRKSTELAELVGGVVGVVAAAVCLLSPGRSRLDS